VSGIVRSSASESPTGFCRSQSFTVLSQLAEARVRLSEEKATPFTLPRWPRRVYRSVGALGARPATRGANSQSFTVASKLAEASQQPSGLKATLRTCCVCALRVTQYRFWGSSSVRGVASQRRTL